MMYTELYLTVIGYIQTPSIHCCYNLQTVLNQPVFLKNAGTIESYKSGLQYCIIFSLSFVGNKLMHRD